MHYEAMATLTIRNLPDEIYAELAKRAKQNRRSINNEAIIQLERYVNRESGDIEQTFLRLKKLREKEPKLFTTKEEIDRAKNEGRL